MTIGKQRGCNSERNCRAQRSARPSRPAHLRRTASRGAAALVAIALLVFAQRPEAKAFECSRVLDNSGTPSGSALSWPTRAITYAFSKSGTSRLDNDLAEATVRQAFATWQNSTLRDGNTSCRGLDKGVPSATDLAFTDAGSIDQSFAGFNFFDPDNNHSMILFRDNSWPYPMTTADRTERMALTTVTFNRIDGTIVDADIEFNSFGYTFTASDSNVMWDLLNIATHEVGHFLGFAHTAVADATMYNMANYGETNKRTLSCDDASILWFRYPFGQPTRACGSGNLNDRCGQCAPPVAPTYRPEASLSRSDGGKGGCSCQQLGGADAGLIGLLLATCCRRRRRRAARQAPVGAARGWSP